jgi:hypothetical protein
MGEIKKIETDGIHKKEMGINIKNDIIELRNIVCF